MMNAPIHILNGDALLQQFPVDGEKIVFRECMMDGPGDISSLDDFYQTRASYIAAAFNESESGYFEKTKPQLDKIASIDRNAAVFLWFEHDLFCQANLWCAINILDRYTEVNNIHIVYPHLLVSKHKWMGFAAMERDDMWIAYKKARLLMEDDRGFALKVWEAYTKNDFPVLQKLSEYSSDFFPETGKSIKAHLDRLPNDHYPGKPQQRLIQLIDQYGQDDFASIFKSFQETEGIYGFGDLQVLSLMRSIP
jgi:hypothetical protein